MVDTILIADDNAELADSIRSFFKQYRYDVVIVDSAQRAINHVARQRPVDVILLDVMLQGMAGWETCRRLREITHVPILILTALNGESDIVRGLDLGADDYLVKPFHFDVLKARLEACLRRARMPGTDGPCLVYSDNDLYIDLPNRDVRVQGRRIRLSPAEFRLLACLLRHEGIVVRHETLLTEVWGSNDMQDTVALRLYVGYLRQKIEPVPSQPQYILTEWKQGYRFCKVHVPAQTPIQELQMEKP